MQSCLILIGGRLRISRLLGFVKSRRREIKVAGVRSERSEFRRTVPSEPHGGHAEGNGVERRGLEVEAELAGAAPGMGELRARRPAGDLGVLVAEFGHCAKAADILDAQSFI
jgi:hypothetical protein